MKVHHLNCGTMHPPRTPALVCHVLLVETDNGLVLVDAGFGSDDCADPPGRVGPVRFITRPVLVPAETAAHQIEQLGFRREDVRHIVVTHFDTDHVGGVSDFPHAQVHVTAAEAFAVFSAPTRQERIRYGRQQWATEQSIVEHSPEGEAWRGFAAAKELDEIASGIALVSLPGHTRGHACVAVDAGHRWVLHCGDAFYHYGTLERTRVPGSLWAMETTVAFDRKTVRDNHARLVELYRRAEPDLLLVAAHDLAQYERAKATA
jgi:glyoxylase-like metal-dependent hydrolase (beta-lactamase superfamily II)